MRKVALILGESTELKYVVEKVEIMIYCYVPVTSAETWQRMEMEMFRVLFGLICILQVGIISPSWSAETSQQSSTPTAPISSPVQPKTLLTQYLRPANQCCQYQNQCAQWGWSWRNVLPGGRPFLQCVRWTQY